MKKSLIAIVSILYFSPAFAVLTTPTQLSPTNASNNNSPNELLDWSASTGATAYEYKINTSPTLNGAIVQSISGSSQVTTSNLLFGTVYYWQVRAIKTTAPIDSSAWSSIWSFTTLDFVTQLSPTTGSINQDANAILDWSAVSGITFYDYQWDTSSTFASPLSVYGSIAAGTSQVTSSNLRFGTKYYWRVRARHSVDTMQWSSVWNFTTLDFATQLSPTTGSINQDANAILDWSALSGITFYDYQWDTSSTFASPVSVYGSIAAGTSQVTSSNLRFGTKYYWRVRARHSVDTTQWSPVWNFTTLDFVTQLSPTTGSINQDANAILDWSAVSGITFYDYQWDTSSTFASPLSFYGSIATGTSQVTSSNLRFGTKYYWRVRARNSADTSQWSSVWNFTTINFVVQVSPTPGAVNQDANTILDWSPLSGITFYDYQWDTISTFTSPLNFYGSIAAGTSQVTSSNLRFGTKYYWRVRARHSADTTQWSSVWNFTTIDFLVHVSPANNAVGVSLNPIIDWSPISGIIGYQYRYSTDINLTNPTIFTPIGTTSQATLSNLSYGYDYFWQVRAYHAVDTTQWTLPWSFTTIYQIIAAPFLSVPSNTITGIPTTGTTLQWTSVTTATSYQYQLDDNSSFTSPLSNSVLTLTGSTGTLTAGTTYYWRVRAGNGSGYSPWSVVWSFTTEGPILTAPILVSPADNSTGIVVSGTTLQWNSVSTATSYEYELDDNTSFTSPLSNSVTTLTAATGTLIAGTTYYWRVRAVNGSGNSPWSVVWSFSTETPTLAAPTIISPADNSTGVLVSGTTLQWSTVNTATSYEYQLDDNSSFTSPLSNIVVTLTASTGTLIAGTTYYWRVRAVNGSGNSPWSDIWSFTTDFITGITNSIEIENFSVYPNPSCGKFIINSTGNIKSIEIYNLQGEEVIKSNVENQESEIDLSNQPNGIYLIKIYNGLTILTKKIIIK